MATKTLKIKYKLKNKTWANPQIKNHTRSHEVRLIRPQKQQKNPEHKYLKFLASLIPSVEETVNLHGLQ